MQSQIICEIRYQLFPDKRTEFEDYARAWMWLIERHGGVHYGFFMPGTAPGDATISFRDRGRDGPDDVAVALYGFPDNAAYDAYRRAILLDEEAGRVIERFAEPPFKSYERIFLSPVKR